MLPLVEMLVACQTAQTQPLAGAPIAGQQVEQTHQPAGTAQQAQASTAHQTQPLPGADDEGHQHQGQHGFVLRVSSSQHNRSPLPAQHEHCGSAAAASTQPSLSTGSVSGTAAIASTWPSLSTGGVSGGAVSAGTGPNSSAGVRPAQAEQTAPPAPEHEPLPVEWRQSQTKRLQDSTPPEARPGKRQHPMDNQPPSSIVVGHPADRLEGHAPIARGDSMETLLAMSQETLIAGGHSEVESEHEDE